MNFKALYFIFNVFALAAGVAAVYCASQISPWAVYVLLLVVIFKFMEGCATAAWEAHRTEQKTKVLDELYERALREQPKK
jgi:hypothetical protein